MNLNIITPAYFCCLHGVEFSKNFHVNFALLGCRRRVRVSINIGTFLITCTLAWMVCQKLQMACVFYKCTDVKALIFFSISIKNAFSD